MKEKILPYIIALGVAILLPQVVLADDHYAKQLANPIAELISVPFEADYDDNIGTNDKGSAWTIVAKPVIPFSISENWNLITRTIVPFITQDDIPFNGAGKSGIGDIIPTFWFSPKKPTSHGIVWGVGPALLLNTASNDVLGANKWGAGPAVIVLRQDEGPWTYGGLVRHIWSFAGNNSSSGVSATNMEPFIAYVTELKTTYTIKTESIYDWEAEEWAVPVIFKAEQMLKIGSQRLQVGGGLRYWAASPSDGPEGFGARITLTFLFPKD